MKILGTLLLTAAVATSGCAKHESHAVDGDKARALLVNRNWLSKMPERKADRFQVFRFIPEFNNSGVYQERTIYAGGFELFAFEHTGEEIRFNLLHTGNRKTARYRIEELRPGEGPASFDLKLTLDQSPRGSATYYGWKNEGHDKKLATAEALDQSLSSRIKE